MPLFRLTLEKTYYRQGFFNVTVDFDRFIRPTEGPVELILGTSGPKIEGKVNRSANLNRTARVMGGSKLRDWFQENYSQGEVIDIHLSSLGSIQIGGVPLGGSAAPGLDRSQPTLTGGSVPQETDKAVTADELARWRRRLVRLLDALGGPQEEREGVVARINRLSRVGRIPRETAALMKVVAEMRNASEYQAKRPSRSESVAIRNSWAAVAEWASSIGIVADAEP